jgi:hypothetical protein
VPLPKPIATRDGVKPQSLCRLSCRLSQLILRLRVVELRLQQERLGLELLRGGNLGLRAQISSLQVKYGSTLEADLIESRAQALQAKQELLTSELQLSDLRMQFNDVVGLPIKSEVILDPSLPASMGSCEREQCIKLALDSHPEIAEARAVVEKASAGVRAAKREYIPDVEAFARYSYQNDVPFFARNFGTFGVHFSYDIFDGGKKRSMVRERDAQLAQARENLARISDEVELRVQTAYNKVERTQQMIAVSQELLAAREEVRRVSAQQSVPAHFGDPQAHESWPRLLGAGIGRPESCSRADELSEQHHSLLTAPSRGWHPGPLAQRHFPL